MLTTKKVTIVSGLPTLMKPMLRFALNGRLMDITNLAEGSCTYSSAILLNGDAIQDALVTTSSRKVPSR